MTFASSDRARLAAGFLSLADTAALAERGVTVFDPHSTLIAAAAQLAQGVVLWPGVIIEIGSGTVAIGAGTVLFPGTRIVAAAGAVAIGERAEIGAEGGFTILAETAACRSTVGDAARLLGGGSLARVNAIGRGAQILGPIRVQDCRLADGLGPREPDPDRRGGVLKGAGVARGLAVPQGHVVQAFGLIAEAPLRKQSFFHPPPRG